MPVDVRGARRAVPALCAALLIASAAASAAYPDRPVRLLVGFAPGGGSDIIGRHFAAKMSDLWGQQMVIDNRPGAGGTLAAEIAARATPDGYTLFQRGVASMTLGPHIYRKLRYDPFKDFAPMTPMAAAPNVLVVHPNVPARSVSELVALAKANPGKLAYGSPGVGTTPHLATELFKSMTGTDFIHVAYKGGSLALTDLLSGQLQLMFDNVQSQLPLIRSNRLRPLGVSWLKRTSLLPDVPTIAESGLPGFETGPWYGLCAIAGTPAPVLATLHGYAMKALNASDMRARIAEQGMEARPMAAAQFGEYIRAESARWAKVIKAAGIQAE